MNPHHIHISQPLLIPILSSMNPPFSPASPSRSDASASAWRQVWLCALHALRASAVQVRLLARSRRRPRQEDLAGAGKLWKMDETWGIEGVTLGQIYEELDRIGGFQWQMVTAQKISWVDDGFPSTSLEKFRKMSALNIVCKKTS